MPRIKFVDLNKALVDKVATLGIESVHADYFLEAYKTSFPVMMTASNPMFTFGGGLDYRFTEHFPKLCEYKRIKGGGNERISNIVFAITVDTSLRADKDIIKEAIHFALGNTRKNETLILSGVGTGIGRMTIDEFVDILKDVLIGELNV